MTPISRLLFVEDDRLVLATLAKGLRDAGYAVSTADTGEAALGIAAEQPFDLAVLDIRMPGLSGIETAQRLRTQYGVPVLFLSAYSEGELVEQAAAAGGLGYVVKPVDIVQLVPAVEAALARARDLKVLAETRVQLEQALLGGRQTSIAIGILMERRGVSEQAAFEALRASARQNRRKLEEVCREVVEAAERLNGV
jgi:DNA-binding response OmpR family regulator